MSDSTEDLNTDEGAPKEENSRRQVQKYMRPEDKKWLIGVIVGLLVSLVSVIVLVVTLFWGWGAVSWVALSGVVIGVVTVIGFSAYGIQYLQKRGLDVSQIGSNALNNTNESIVAQPTTIEEADKIEKESR